MIKGLGHMVIFFDLGCASVAPVWNNVHVNKDGLK
jgi:hypothetical protein